MAIAFVDTCINLTSRKIKLESQFCYFLNLDKAFRFHSLIFKKKKEREKNCGSPPYRVVLKITWDVPGKTTQCMAHNRHSLRVVLMFMMVSHSVDQCPAHSKYLTWNAISCLFAPDLSVVLLPTGGATLGLHNWFPGSDLGFSSTYLCCSTQLLTSKPRKSLYFPHPTNTKKAIFFHISINYLYYNLTNSNTLFKIHHSNLLLHITFCASPSRSICF